MPDYPEVSVAVEVYAEERKLANVPHAAPILEGWSVRLPGKRPIKMLTQGEALEFLLTED